VGANDDTPRARDLDVVAGVMPSVAGAQTTDAQTGNHLDTLLTDAAVVPDRKRLVPTALAERRGAEGAKLRVRTAWRTVRGCRGCVGV
jgi:hypothetical protein